MALVRWLSIVIALCLFVTSSVSYKILLVPLSQGSHVSCIMAIARELGRRQHEVHIVVDEGYKVEEDMVTDAKTFNITLIRPVQNRASTEDRSKDLITQVLDLMKDNKGSFRDLLAASSRYVDAHAKLLLLDNEPITDRLHSEHYDLAVIDGIFCTKHFFLLAHRLGIPWITYTDYPDQWRMRAPWLPSIVPGKHSFQSEKMSLLGRISNAWLSSQAQSDEQNLKVPDDIIKRYQQYGAFDSPEELMERSKFWILLSDAIIDSPKPMMSNMIEVGGLTTQPAKKLPEDIQNFLDGAKDGVIVMSFGTMLSSFPDFLLRKFLDAFNKIQRHRIIWRLTNVSSEFKIPDFIRCERWLPQNDILAHPKVKLLITHCGNNGQFEALYHGVIDYSFMIYAVLTMMINFLVGPMVTTMRY